MINSCSWISRRRISPVEVKSHKAGTELSLRPVRGSRSMSPPLNSEFLRPQKNRTKKGGSYRSPIVIDIVCSSPQLSCDTRPKRRLKQQPIEYSTHVSALSASCDTRRKRQRKQNPIEHSTHVSALFAVGSRPVEGSIRLAVAATTPTRKKNRMLESDHKQILEDSILRDSLDRVRRYFAETLDVAPFQIFHDSTINSIIENLPTTAKRLLACDGIGRREVESFGSTILQIVELHIKQYAEAESDVVRAIEQQPISEDEEGDEHVIMEKSLTISEVLKEKFETAKKNDEIIVL